MDEVNLKQEWTADFICHLPYFEIAEIHNAALAAEREKYENATDNLYRDIKSLNQQLAAEREAKESAEANCDRLSHEKHRKHQEIQQLLEQLADRHSLCVDYETKWKAEREKTRILGNMIDGVNGQPGIRQQLAAAQVANNELRRVLQSFEVNPLVSQTLQITKDSNTDCLDAYVREKVNDFATKILHGDDVHKAWLTEAAEAYCDGHSLPEPRSKPITDDEVNEAWDELMSELDVGFITDGKTYECGQCGGKGKSKSEVKHEDGCIHPAIDKVSNLNRKAAARLREQMKPLVDALHEIAKSPSDTGKWALVGIANDAYETAIGNVKEK